MAGRHLSIDRIPTVALDSHPSRAVARSVHCRALSSPADNCCSNGLNGDQPSWAMAVLVQAPSPPPGRNASRSTQRSLQTLGEGAGLGLSCSSSTCRVSGQGDTTSVSTRKLLAGATGPKEATPKVRLGMGQGKGRACHHRRPENSHQKPRVAVPKSRGGEGLGDRVARPKGRPPGRWGPAAKL